MKRVPVTLREQVVTRLSVKDTDVSLHIPRDGEETGILEASLDGFRTYASEKIKQTKCFWRLD